MVTTLSLLAGIMCIMKFINQKYMAAAVWWMVQYFFDCLDGHMARKYDQVTVFGDYYDHVKDWLIGGVFMILLLGKYIKSRDYWAICLLIVLLLMGNLHIGCQELYRQYTHHGESPMLHNLKYLCPGYPEKTMKWSSYFGWGTINLYIAFLICYVPKLNYYE